MINDKRMKFLSTEEDVDYYLFKPSVFRLYYENRIDDASHRHTLSHIIHMLAYLFMGGYNILYLSQKDKIVSYIIFTKCKSWIVKGSSKNDYYTIFLWTYPQNRNHGFATKMSKYMLNNLGICYEYFYKTIAKDNISSICVAEKSGFNQIGEASKQGVLHTIVNADNGPFLLFKNARKKD